MAATTVVILNTDLARAACHKASRTSGFDEITSSSTNGMRDQAISCLDYTAMTTGGGVMRILILGPKLVPGGGVEPPRY